MSRGSFLYGLWCLGIVGAFSAASVYGYSPFANGGKVAARGVGGGYYGPTHK